MDGTLEDRLAAVERALTDDDHDLAALAEAGGTAERVETLEGDLAALEERVAELEAATQALRGYVGNVRAVNEDVRERADRALDLAEQANRETTADPGDRDRSSHTAASDTVTDTADATDTTDPATTTPDRGTAPARTGTDEPTLELAADETPGRSPANSSGRETCPLCAEDTDRSGDRTDGRERHAESATRTARDITDGGGTPSEDSPDDTDGTVLARIRDCL